MEHADFAKYALSLLVIFLAAFFLQPATTAMMVGSVYSTPLAPIMKGFDRWQTRRLLVAAIGLAASGLAPWLFGISPFVPIVIFLSLAALCACDAHQSFTIVKKLTAQ